MKNINYDEEIRSNCCGSSILGENAGEGICAECHEHCAVAEEEGENDQELERLSAMGEENL